MVQLSEQEICRLLPHAGDMCLLSAVESWDEDKISCRAISQTDQKNPLRHNGEISAISGVEYAAQAMGVHGALLDTSADTPTLAYLAALRGVKLHNDSLHQYPEITISCHRLGGDQQGFIYTFEIKAGDTLILEGRATVMKEKEQHR